MYGLQRYRNCIMSSRPVINSGNVAPCPLDFLAVASIPGYCCCQNLQGSILGLATRFYSAHVGIFVVRRDFQNLCAAHTTETMRGVRLQGAAVAGE